MRNSHRRVPLLGLLLLGATAAQAAEPYAGVSVGQLSQVQSETLLYQAMAERAKAKRALEAEGGSLTSPTPRAQPGAAPVSAQAPETLPVVKSILGSRGSMRAVLLYSGGLEVNAYLGGGELPGGYTVSALTLDRVELTRNGQRYPLGFSNQEPAATGTPSTTRSGVPVAPGLPGRF
ncbi:type IV pilus biogenesis protein PilP [Azotobacter bryophylli]|uniref:Type IV pilus biogenesis protein PilP n=1 Tax=Azotobacter bryophylli TaxID=1986537 RepID=A0ABV7AWU5_9GAMM